MTINGISQNSISKIIKIESQSVNSVLLDTSPNDYHERHVYHFYLSIIYINIIIYYNI